MTLEDTTLLAELGELLAGRVARRGVVGLAVRPGANAPAEILWTPAGDEREPAFPAYSITKVLIAVLVLQQVDAGELALDDPLARWFPQIDRAERATLRQLLQHRAGIPDYGAIVDYHRAVRETPDQPWDFDEYGRRTWGQGLSFEPGEAFAYSNPGYMLLVRILGSLLGESFREMVSRRITGPLGLERTFVAETTADWSGVASGPSRLLDPDFVLRDPRRVYHPGWVSHGVVVSTASEILRFFEAVFEARAISAERLRDMMDLVSIDRAVEVHGDPSYGLGLMGDLRAPQAMFGHNGGGPGYTTSAFHVPTLFGGATVAVMAGIEDGEFASGILRDVFAHLRTR